MEGFAFSTEVRVRFAETDAQGIAHHASFLVWFEVARVAYLEEYAGGYRAIRERGLEALTTEVHVRYHRAAYFDDRLTVWTRCAELRGARFRYEYRVERDGELVADGSTSHATVDREHVPADARAGRGSPRPSLGQRRRRRSLVGRLGPGLRRLRVGLSASASTFVPTRTTRVSPR